MLALNRAYLRDANTRLAVRGALTSSPSIQDAVEAQGSFPAAVSSVGVSEQIDDVVTRIVVGSVEASTWSAEAARLIASAPTPYVLVLDPAMSIERESIDELLRVAEESGASVVQPVVLGDDGLVIDAGAVFASRGSPPMRLFEGFLPVQLPQSDFYRARAAVVPAVLLRPAALPALVDGERADVALARASIHGGVVVARNATVEVPASMRGRFALHERARLAWSGFPTDDLVEPRASDIIADAGFRLEGLRGDGVPDLAERLRVNELSIGRIVRPVLRAAHVQGKATQNTARASSRRWTIRSGTPLGPEGRTWGDAFFADDLAVALRAAGQQVLIDTRETIVRPDSDYLDDVVVSLRGLYRIPPNPAAINILWVISHPEVVTVDELESYDLVFAAGPAWAARMDARCSVPVVPLLQATSPHRFAPGPADEELASDVLFVGKTRNVFRPIVRDALAVGADLAIYGDGWERFIDAEHVREQFLPNESLSAAYRSARIVLNDHWQDMADDGFLSNRLFDAIASGARVVTDPVRGLELFGDGVRPYYSTDELRELLSSDEGWPSNDEQRAIADRIRVEHSFDARARRLIDAVEELERLLRR